MSPNNSAPAKTRAPEDAFDRTPKWVDVRTPPEGKLSPGECATCGLIIKIGFFFDAFGRHRDLDSPADRQSNVAKLWLAHKDNSTRGRPLQHIYLKYYYSGLGTPLNSDAGNNAAAVAAKAIATKAISTMGENIAEAIKKDSGAKDLAAAWKKANDPFSTAKDFAKDWFINGKSTSETWGEIKENVKSTSTKVMKVLRFDWDELWQGIKAESVDKFKGFWYDITKRPLQAAKGAVVGAISYVTVENVPFLRDSKTVSALTGMGMDTRLDAAEAQLREALATIGVAPDNVTGTKTQRIEVSVFGADRGCVLARAFVNLINEKFRLVKSPTGLGYAGVPIEIKFVGLFDAVSSLMEKNQLVSIIPHLAFVKQDHSDRKLSIPPGIECVHMLAAHELRFYQRVDSLELTRGEQFVFPGSSEDVVGGTPPGRSGLRNALARVPLREMHMRAMAAGVPLYRMERLKHESLDLFQRFSFAPLFYSGGKPYRVDQLIDAYRKHTKSHRAETGAALKPILLAHTKTFLWWLGRRYMDGTFWDKIEGELREKRKPYTDLYEQSLRDEAAFQDHINAHGHIPQDEQAREERRALALKKRKSKADFDAILRQFNEDYAMRPVHGIWGRLIHEAVEMRDTRDEAARRKPYTDALQEQEEAEAEFKKFQEEDFRLGPGRHTPERDKKRVELARRKQAAEKRVRELQRSSQSSDYAASRLTANEEYKEKLELLQVFEDGVLDRNSPPPEVLTLFDELVHDTLLTSWHDHILAHNLYFRTRAIDHFGETDKAAEEKQKKDDEWLRKRMEQQEKSLRPPSMPGQPKAGAVGGQPQSGASAPLPEAPIVRFP